MLCTYSQASGRLPRGGVSGRGLAACCSLGVVAVGASGTQAEEGSEDGGVVSELISILSQSYTILLNIAGT